MQKLVILELGCGEEAIDFKVVEVIPYNDLVGYLGFR